MRTRLFGTLFYANYLVRALALHRSLETYFGTHYTLVMLAMDAEAERVLEQLSLQRVRIKPIRDLEAEDSVLESVKAARSIAEYSWTCAPALLRSLLKEVPEGETVAYLDADLMFFADPQPIFDEWGANDIAIHGHRFASAHMDKLEGSGIFNVGFVGLRNAKQGRACLERWYAQCIDACCLDLARGLCGDQKYLDEWPALYDRLTILEHKGVGVGPWNIEQYTVAEVGGRPHVDGVPVIFYHYHAMRVLADDLFGELVIRPASGYDFSPVELRTLYHPYAVALRDGFRAVRRAAPDAVWAPTPWSAREVRAFFGQAGLVSSSHLLDAVFRQADRLRRGKKMLARRRRRLRNHVY